MASMRDIKRRRSSITSTSQITKAMKLVSTVKLQKSRGKAESSRPYFNLMYKTISEALEAAGNIDHKYLKSGDSKKKAVIAISSNRGLAGGFNNNIVKLVMAAETLPKEDTYVYAIGKKGRDGLARKGYNIYKDYSDVVNDPLYRDASELTTQLLEAYAEGEIGEIYLAYTSFKNTVVHIPKLLKLLPLTVEAQELEDEEKKPQAPMNFEPNPDEVLNAVIPKYMSSLIYGAMLESVASENGARMNAMENATSNAEEMLGKLELQYNRARQGAITQELTEIIAGANAIS